MPSPVLTLLKEITLNLDTPNDLVYVSAKQYDVLARKVKINLVHNAAPWVIPAGLGGVIRYIKPDQTRGMYDTDDDDNPAIAITAGSSAASPGNIMITLARQVLTTKGTIKIEVSLYSAAAEKLTTFSFPLVVEEAALSDIPFYESEDYFNFRSDMATIQQLNDAFATATQAAVSGVLTIDNTLSISGAIADAKAAGDMIQVSETEPTETSNILWIKESEEEVLVPTWEDFDNLKNSLQTGTFFQDRAYGNLYSISEKKDGKYPSSIDGQINFVNNPDYNSFILKIDECLPIYVSYVRFYAFLEEDRSTIIGGTVTDFGGNIAYRIYSPENAKYLVVGYTLAGCPDDYIVNVGGGPITDTTYLPKWIKKIKSPYQSQYKSTLSNNQGMFVGAFSEPRKNLNITFFANISSFSYLYVGLAKTKSSIDDSNLINKVLISNTNCVLLYNDGATRMVPHGLTIANNIQVSFITNDRASVSITVISNGQKFEMEEQYTYAQINQGVAFAGSIGSELLDCVLGWSIGDIRKQIWYFGDSYTAFAEDRWPYYAMSWINNILLDGFGGETSDAAYKSFSELLSYGTPEYAVWSLGMNDPSDSGNTPNATWKTYLLRFISICEYYGVVPILCTIPSTPTRNNEGKNAYIRSLKYKYIDFAKAVDPNGDGVWFSGMLNSDNVHPTALGAKALYSRMVSDFPAFFIK